MRCKEDEQERRVLQNASRWLRTQFKQLPCVYLVDRVETNTVRDQSFCDLEEAFFGKRVVKRQLPVLVAKHKNTVFPSLSRAKG